MLWEALSHPEFWLQAKNSSEGLPIGKSWNDVLGPSQSYLLGQTFNSTAQMIKISPVRLDEIAIKVTQIYTKYFFKFC